ncbi:hypothetical protein PGO51_03960 [Klebsiella aerogenes]
MNKPVIFSDLDDTLFQTKRKMKHELDALPFRCAALDRDMQPRSFMDQEQAMFVDWLLENAELIPVTARGSEELKRVQIAFSSWAIATHGAVIITPEGLPDAAWQQHMMTRLAPYADRLTAMQHEITAQMALQGINGWARINQEYDGTPVYLVMKHRDSTRVSELYAFADWLQQRFPLEGFYFHRNGNNVAWIPEPVDKGLAVGRLLNKLQAERGTFPVLGFGDSLSDHRFLQLCHWFAVPQQSQYARAINQHVFAGS